jgi:hypothetical protein
MKLTDPVVVSNGSDLIPWLSFGASVILALITLWYVILTARMLKQSQMVEATRRRQQFESQASQIAAWVSSSAVADRDVSVETTLFNPTSQAVYDVRVVVVDMNGGVLPSPPYLVAILGPGDRLTHSVRCRLPPNAGGSLRTALTFTDGQGIIWRRAEDGRLVEQIEGRNIVVQE